MTNDAARMTDKELVARIQGEESNLIYELWEQLRPFFMWLSNRMYSHYKTMCNLGGVELDDVIHLSWLALCSAVKKYNPDRDCEFTSYALWFFKKELWRACDMLRTHQDALVCAITGDDATKAMLAAEEPDALRDFAAVELHIDLIR